MRSRIEAAGGDLSRIVIVAVTKGFGADAPLAALRAGLTDLGENYAAELIAKAAAVAEGDPPLSPRWHFLGAIQRNKIPRLSPVVTCWQSVARAEESVAIARRAFVEPEVFVEVDVSGSPGRGGCSLEEAPDVVEASWAAGCRVRGLMTVAPLAPSAAAAGGSGGEAGDVTAPPGAIAAEAFGKVAQLASSLGLGELSMGMSQDLEEAVAAGTTMVRVGTALFGPRASR